METSDNNGNNVQSENAQSHGVEINTTPTNQIETVPQTEQSQTPPKILRWSITPKGKNPAHIGACVIHPDGSIGIVVGGQNSVTFGGKPAACIGDKVECPGHTGVIMQGAKSVTIGGKSLAREGDKTSCGGVIMNGFPTITVFDHTKTVHGKSADENTTEITLSMLESIHSNQTAYAGMPYTLKLDGQEISKGIIDEKGELSFEVNENSKNGKILLANGQAFAFELIDNIENEEQRLSNLGFVNNEDNRAREYFDLVNQGD